MAAAEELVHRTSQIVGTPPRSTWYNYTLVAALESVSSSFVRSRDGDVLLLMDNQNKAVGIEAFREMNEEQQRSVSIVGTLLFAGGTSLTSALEITPRMSLDIDLVMVGRRGNPIFGYQQDVLGVAVAGTARRGVGGDIESDEPSEVGTFQDGVRGIADIEHLDIKISVDVVVEPGAVLLPPVLETVNSLIRYACPDQEVQSNPEFGGFKLPCLPPEITAVNKLSALHNKALENEATESGDFAGLRQRPRDLLDLKFIADSQERVGRVRSIVKQHGEVMAAAGYSPRFPRPEGGYGSSEVFNYGRIPAVREQGTPAYQALCQAYDETLPTLIYQRVPWSPEKAVVPPSAEECVAAVFSLDLEN